MLNLDKIRISPQTLQLISEIDSFKGAWAALEKHTTTLNLLGDVAHFGRTFKSVLEPLQNKEITEDMARQLHRIATASKEKSVYRNADVPLTIQKDGRVFGRLETAPPDEAAALMGKLIPWLNEAMNEKKHHPLIVISLFTSVFLQISPFEKGNQKLSRLLMTLLMFKAGYSYAPYVALEPLLNERLEEYYKTLAAVQESLQSGRADWEPWLIFTLNWLKDQKDVLARKLDAGGDAMAAMPALSTKVLKLFEDHDRLSMKEIERLTRGRRSTLKLRLGELVEHGHIVRHGQARSTWYARA